MDMGNVPDHPDFSSDTGFLFTSCEVPDHPDIDPLPTWLRPSPLSAACFEKPIVSDDPVGFLYDHIVSSILNCFTDRFVNHVEVEISLALKEFFAQSETVKEDVKRRLELKGWGLFMAKK
jgi:hypothetical protein